MARLKTWRYDPPVTKEERVALQSEFWVMALLVAIGLVCVFAEPLMDAFMAMLGVR